ncbi:MULTISPECIES: hypothetical protein [Streptomyces]|uniref:hypothetical protein n=1 Tax=Streptomyces TaxID=1883 RepID=UPI001679B3C5|nr:hypothetical protein [Streptomyces canarius]
MGAEGRRGAERGGWDDPEPGKGLRRWADVLHWGGMACVVVGWLGLCVRMAMPREWDGPWWQAAALIGAGGAAAAGAAAIERHIRRVRRFHAYREMLENPAPPPAEPGADPSVFRLLSPLHSPVPFRDREDELARLRHWCEDETDPHPIMLLAGDRGVGRSRLALELVRALGDSWTAGRLLRGSGRLLPALRDRGRPALVVVDDADLRSDVDSHLHSLVRADVVPLLREFGARPHGTTPVRLLFVVRHAERFRAVVGEELDYSRGDPDVLRLLANAPVLNLAPPVLDRAVLAERRAEASAAFAAALADAAGTERADGTEAAHAGASLGTVPVRPERTPLQTPLDLHAQALVTALTGEKVPALPRRFEEVAGVLFARERRRWRRSAASFTGPGVPALPRLPDHPDLPERVMLTMLLTGHRQYVTASHILERLPEFAGLEEEPIRSAAYAWVTWALALHGGTRPATRMAEPWIGPETLTHWFLTTRLRAEPELFDRLWTGLNAHRSEHLAGVLCRACEDFPAAGEILQRYVASRPSAHGYDAVRGARLLAHPERVDPWIAEGLRKLEPGSHPALSAPGSRDLYDLARQALPEVVPRSHAVLIRAYRRSHRAEDKQDRQRRRELRRRGRGSRT